MFWCRTAALPMLVQQLIQKEDSGNTTERFLVEQSAQRQKDLGLWKKSLGLIKISHLL